MTAYADFQQWQHSISTALWCVTLVCFGVSLSLGLLLNWLIRRARDLQMLKECQAISEARRAKWRRLGYYATNTVADWELEH